MPILVPVLVEHFGFDPLWLAILISVNLQTSFLTPPFGFSLFFLRGAAPPEERTVEIYQGALPFVALQAIGLALTIVFPILVFGPLRFLRS